jgi:hypothetical protein
MEQASKKEFISELEKRVRRVASSLQSLKHPGSAYGIEHKRLLDFYTTVLAAAKSAA